MFSRALIRARKTYGFFIIFVSIIYCKSSGQGPDVPLYTDVMRKIQFSQVLRSRLARPAGKS